MSMYCDYCGCEILAEWDDPREADPGVIICRGCREDMAREMESDEVSAMFDAWAPVQAAKENAEQAAAGQPVLSRPARIIFADQGFVVVEAGVCRVPGNRPRRRWHNRNNPKSNTHHHATRARLRVRRSRLEAEVRRATV